MPPAFVMLNPFAESGRAAALAAPVRDWLAAHAPGVPLVVADSIGRSVATLQLLPGGTRVVLIGGDGTVHQMLPVLLTHSHVLGLVPLGSGNDTARALGVHGMPWQRALANALSAQPSPMDAGELRTARARVPFISSLAAGFDAAVSLRARRAPRWLSGMPRYLWATLAELAQLRNLELRVTVDGVLRHAGSALFASTLNTPSYGSGMPAVPHARVSDGHLDLLLAGHFGRVSTLLMLPRLLTGRHLSHARVNAWSFDHLSVECTLDVPLAADGEPIASAKAFEVRVRPRALSVVMAPN
jgi:diacylglycerol kinase family enzyme